MTEGKIHYYSLSKYLKENFGGKVYKIALDGGFTCPNRDGAIDTRGCIFCSAGGSGEFAQNREMSISKQIESGIELVKKKVPQSGMVGYVAYFQAFTNTYGDLDDLRAKYTEALNNKNVVAVSIATRPDCLSEEVLDLLEELNKVKPIWVELGLQTAKKETADYIRRGYSLDVFDCAVENLKKAGIYTIVHVILGLPGETIDDMLNTVSYVVNSEVKGIKLQLLHVLKGTDLEEEYKQGKFRTLELDEYVNIICECLKIIPDDVVVHRLTGDGDRRLLVAPLWSLNKKNVLNEMAKKITPD